MSAIRSSPVTCQTALIVLCTAVTISACSTKDQIVEYKPPLSYYLGDSVVVDTVNFASTEKTILLAIRETCGSCVASIAFYRHLSALNKELQKHSSTQFVVITSEDSQRVAEMLRQQAVLPDQILSKSNGQALSFRSPRIPTLVVVDKSAKVIGSWVGELNSSEQAEVLATINRGL